VQVEGGLGAYVKEGKSLRRQKGFVKRGERGKRGDNIRKQFRTRAWKTRGWSKRVWGRSYLPRAR